MAGCHGNLHAVVGRTAAPLRAHPVDVLGGTLDVASLAVDAVLRVYLQPNLSLFTALQRHVLVNTFNFFEFLFLGFYETGCKKTKKLLF